MPRELRQTIFRLWRPVSTYLEAEGRLLRRDGLVRAHLFASPAPVEWGRSFSSLGDVLISTPGNLKSISLSALRLVTGPGIQRQRLGGSGTLGTPTASVSIGL